MSEYRYRAFISYSHSDEHWAKWLHRSLETYRIPGKLVGAPSDHGPIPKRLQPIFRDRDELGSAADLSQQVREALAQSAALIVICSPRAAASKWVNEEIREFRRLGRGDRIFSMIVDGDPLGTDDTRCFPTALTESSEGQQTEPLAADARKWADGRRLSILKLMAGVLGIPLDSLRRRDLQRRQRNWIMTTVALVALALVLTLAVTSKIAAEKRRAFAEELVGFKLNDVDAGIELPADYDMLARLSEWSAADRAEALNPSKDFALTAAMELRSNGLKLRRSGDRDGALEQFRESWLIFAAWLSARPDDRELLFELGQAEFWIGQVMLEQRQFDKAERSMAVYADISRRLLRASPEDADAVLEMAYALTNLGSLEMFRESARPERALQYMQSALEFNQIALVLDPGSELYRSELEQSHANIADAQRQVCDLGGALHSRMESTRLAREFHQEAPGDERKRRLLSYTLGGLANVQLSIGLVDLAQASLAESIELLQVLADEQPENNNYRFVLLERRSRFMNTLIQQERLEQAEEMIGALEADWESYMVSDIGESTIPRVNYAEFQLFRESLAASRADFEVQRQALNSAQDLLLSVLEQSPDIAIARLNLAMSAYRYWVLTGELPSDQVMSGLPQLVQAEAYRRSCFDINVAARIAVMQGDVVAAESYTAYLLSKGYYEPEFIRFCRTRELCK